MKNWFLQKNDTEQKIIVLLGIFTALVLLMTFLYLPIKRSNAQLQTNINDIQTEITAMRSMEAQIARFSNTRVETVARDANQMMVLIEQLAKQQQITLSNIKTQGKNKISVSLNNVDFNTAVRWLDLLQTQYHISISHLSVEAEKQGLTNITIIISY